MKRAGLYYHTLRHLRPKQVQYRLYYALRDRWRQIRGFRYPMEVEPPQVAELSMLPSLPAPESWLGPRRFRFLNLEHQFAEGIDWDFPGYGKLWTYNLNYFDYLHQQRMNPETGRRLMQQLIKDLEGTQNALEPYPLSLRLINWIKFVVRQQIQDSAIDRSLYAQYLMLSDQLEYHLLGNHLLENAFALLFGLAYFRDQSGRKQVLGLLERELEEQVLPDGGHFERSPMYHQIILFRLLDALNLVQHNRELTGDFLSVLRAKASAMLGWLRQMTFAEDRIPLFNDSAQDIAPPTSRLLDYGRRLGVDPDNRPLGESGYRRLEGMNYTLLADVGPIGPDYIPGHAHCDTLSFVMEVDGKPWIVDTGTSTYEKNARRLAERSTAAHNVVQINDWEQSEVWGGFRVARRAHPHIHRETETLLEASHDGYARYGYTHRRLFRLAPDGVEISDRVEGPPAERVRAFFHFAPGTELHLTSNSVDTKLGTLSFSAHTKLEKTTYAFAPRFNRMEEAPLLIVTMRDSLQTTIKIKP